MPKASKVVSQKLTAVSKSSNLNTFTVDTTNIQWRILGDFNNYTFKINSASATADLENLVYYENTFNGNTGAMITRYQFNDSLNIYELIDYTSLDIDLSEILNKSRTNCEVRIYHEIPDGRVYEYNDGDTCYHPGECEVKIVLACDTYETIIPVNGLGGGGPGSGTGPGGAPGGGDSSGTSGDNDTDDCESTGGIGLSDGSCGGIYTGPNEGELEQAPQISTIFQLTTQYLSGVHSWWWDKQATPSQKSAIETFLDNSQDSQGYYSQEALAFVKEAIQIFIEFDDVTWSHIENWFLEEPTGKDYFYDSSYWEDENLTFPQQNLPSWNDFNNGYPRENDGSYMTGADNVYSFVGGDVAQARVNYPNETNNTCALKVSIALNAAGVNIPEITTLNGEPGTLQGADGNFYFLNAKALNIWMRKTFGTFPQNSNHVEYHKSEGGNNGKNFPSILNGKKGIYSMIPESPNNFGASGHADLFNGDTCAAGCYFPSVGKIDFWILN